MNSFKNNSKGKQNPNFYEYLRKKYGSSSDNQEVQNSSSLYLSKGRKI
jgi:hypothetical protein